MKRICLFLILGLLAAGVWAGGRKDNESYIADDPAGFTEIIDTSARVEKNKKKYNFYLEAQDKGGNTVAAGPYNIFIDPESDLPVVTIVNPRENMHVRGNLNIVGTCVDDDAVQYVELWFNDDKNTMVRAEGSEFWSYQLDTRAIADNLYRISVRGVDINGVAGRVRQVNWHLDRKKPETRVTSHRLGALVNGKIRLKGTVFDGNGVKNLQYSLEETGKYTPISLKYDKKANLYAFDAAVDTTALADGPVVVWFKAFDALGTAGTASHLLFVDNTGPDVRIQYPGPDEAVNGIFTVAGYANDTVGLESLKWKLGKETGELPLVVGNPWWAQEFDIRGQKVSSLDLEIHALDLSGNVTVSKRKLKVDQAADLPTVTLDEPLAQTPLPGNVLTLSGRAADNDAVAAVLYAIDGGEPAEIPCSDYFQHQVPDMVPGIHTVHVWAKDRNGTEGPKLEVKGVIAPGNIPAPRVQAVRFGAGKEAVEEAFYTGKTVHPELGAVLRLTIDSGSPLAAFQWRFGEREPESITIKKPKAGEGAYIHDITLPADTDYGLVRLELQADDIYGQEGRWEEFVYITDLSTVNPDEATAVRDASSGNGLRLESLNGEAWRAGMAITLPLGGKTGVPLTASFNGDGVLASAVFAFGERTVKASVRDGLITAAIPADIAAGRTPVTLTATLKKSGEQLAVSGECFVLRPAEGRKVNTRNHFQWVRPDDSPGDGRLLISGRDKPLLGLYTGRPVQSAALSGEGSDSLSVVTDTDGRIMLTVLNEGSYGPLTVTITDKDGGVYESGPFTILADYAAPELTLRDAVDGLWVQNSLTIKPDASDQNLLTDLSWSYDMGRNWSPLVEALPLAEVSGNTASAEQELDLTPLPDGLNLLHIRATDEAGRNTVKTIRIRKDTQAPAPRLIVPVSGAQVNGTIRLGIAVAEAGIVSSAVYELPETAPAEADPETEPETQVPALTKNLYDVSGAEKPLYFLDILLDAQENPLAENMRLTFTDAAGNVSVMETWPFVIDTAMDIPSAQISLPLENEVITSDFEVSGIAWDDDAIVKIHWHIDDNPDTVAEITHGYSLAIPLSGLTDNEHTVTVVAEDMYGVKSEAVTRKFRVSLEEPKAALVTPAYDVIVKQTVRLSGTAGDKNGVASVQISLDNGNTYNDTGMTIINEDDNSEIEWHYEFNSPVLEDGTHVVFMQVYDNYGISALYSSMVNLDNTPPDVSLNGPLDGLTTSGIVNVIGRAADNVLIDKIAIELRSLDGHAVPEAVASRTAEPGSLLLETLDLSELPDGLYNIEVWAMDKAENTTRVSRNVQLGRNTQQNYVDILYPMNGEHTQGSFNLYGVTGGAGRAGLVTLMINGRHAESASVTEAGYYRFELDKTKLVSGLNTIAVSADFGPGETVTSAETALHYRDSGAWVTIDTLAMGDFAYERPWLSGRAGYALSEEDEAITADKEAGRELKEQVRAKKLQQVELSYDNGKTFFPADKGKNSDWSFRLENGDMAEGKHYLLVRANMANGETAVTRTLIQIDKTPPHIRLIAPEPGGSYNASLEYTALASDDIDLLNLSYHLRKGDKAAYEVPGFIQGLYVEGIIPPFIKQAANDAPVIFAGGATYMDVGMGLSFFDDNVKVQLQYGFLTQELFEKLGGQGKVRYGGQVLGLKLLANLYTLPFGSLGGPDWEWLSASLSLGANFSLFDIASEGYTQSGNPTWMSALVTQLEFPKVTIPKWKKLRTFSLFTEGQLWFVPTDVDAAAYDLETVIPHAVIGLRLYIF